MATQISEALNATGMSLAIFCGGMSKVGIGLSGTWTGTVKFFGSTDGINFIPLTVTPFASGTGVQSATATGNWEVLVQNYVVVKVVFTRTTGTAVVKLATSIDSSYQIAFLASTSIFVNQAATAATNTVTIAAQTNRAWRLRTLVISVNATATWASSPNVTISDGASSVIWAVDLTTAAQTTNVPLPADPDTPGVAGGGVVTTPGNSLVIAVASGAGSVKTNVNAEVIAA